MLILSRFRNEIIDIEDTKTGTSVQVMVVDIRGDKIRIGVEAPDHVSINRREITEEIEAERREAS